MPFPCLLSTKNQVIKVKMNQKEEFVSTPTFGWQVAFRNKKLRIAVDGEQLTYLYFFSLEEIIDDFDEDGGLEYENDNCTEESKVLNLLNYYTKCSSVLNFALCVTQ